MGRRAHRPDERGRRQVEALAAYGVPELHIARVVGIDPKTLRKHYRDELDLGATKATAKVAEFLFRKATTEGPQCVTAAIFWMKTRGGWREAPQAHEVSMKTASEMTDAELEARIRELDTALGRPLLELKPAFCDLD
ncbi:MAG: hypothetical protein KDK07_15720 [Bauldia sp.]|nr:hypothetical protein [Bauldia sp.]